MFLSVSKLQIFFSIVAFSSCNIFFFHFNLFKWINDLGSDSVFVYTCNVTHAQLLLMHRFVQMIILDTSILPTWQKRKEKKREHNRIHIPY